MKVNGKLRTAEAWACIEDERAEREEQTEREAQLEAEEADMVTYHGYAVTSEFAEQMERY